MVHLDKSLQTTERNRRKPTCKNKLYEVDTNLTAAMKGSVELLAISLLEYCEY